MNEMCKIEKPTLQYKGHLNFQDNVWEGSISKSSDL